MTLTSEQQLHLDTVFELSNKHVKNNYDYGNTLSRLYFVYQDIYMLENRYDKLFMAYSKLVDDYQRLKNDNI